MEVTPVAVTGIGCRFPGPSGAGSLLGADGRRRDAIDRSRGRPQGATLYHPETGRGRALRR